MSPASKKNKEIPKVAGSGVNGTSPTSTSISGKGRILSQENPILRQTAKEVPVKDIQTPAIQQVIRDMRKALADQSDGIGLAAPQIGVPLRIFIVSKKISVSAKTNEKEKIKEKPEKSVAEKTKKDPKQEDSIFINPVIVKESREKKWMEGEGCLSVRWIYGKVRRSTKVTLRAYDEQGKIIERGAGGLLAHIFQHEVDHLNGILFIDKAKDLEYIEPDHDKVQREK